MASAITGARPEAARAAVHVEVCGTVSTFIAPGTLTPGAVTIGGVPFVLATGATVDASVHAGANLCADLTLGADGKVVGIDTSANRTSTVEIRGTIQAYSDASSTATGHLRLLGLTFTLTAGATMPAGLDVGQSRCFRLTLNGLGQVKDADIVADAKTSVKICGVVSAVTDATTTRPGTLTIAGRTFEAALGAALPATVKTGANLCLQLTLDPFGQVGDANVKTGANATVQVCGTVAGFRVATLTNDGSLKIGGRTYATALGSHLPAAVKPGADLCLRLTLNAFGQVSDGQVLANVGSALDVCGTVTTLLGATNTPDGRLVVGGIDKPIAAATEVCPAPSRPARTSRSASPSTPSGASRT
jgi:hypothetical protein